VCSAAETPSLTQMDDPLPLRPDPAVGRRPLCCESAEHSAHDAAPARAAEPAGQTDTGTQTTAGPVCTGSDPLKIGVIGLGDIAQKAYLPVLAASPV